MLVMGAQIEPGWKPMKNRGSRKLECIVAAILASVGAPTANIYDPFNRYREFLRIFRERGGVLQHDITRTK
jgi:hypothetical protein